MAGKTIYVEVTEGEAALIATAIVRCDPEIISSERKAIKMFHGETVSEQRIRDRFDIAASTNGMPAPFLGEAIFIQRGMG